RVQKEALRTLAALAYDQTREGRIIPLTGGLRHYPGISLKSSGGNPTYSNPYPCAGMWTNPVFGLNAIACQLCSGCRLVVPDVGAGIGIDRYDRRCEQIVALVLAAPLLVP